MRLTPVKKMYLCIVLFLVGAMGLAYSETGETTGEKRPRRFIPFPMLFYSPETGLGFGAGAHYYVYPQRDAVVQKAEAINGIAFYTVQKQMLLSLSMNRYFRRSGNLLRVQAVGMKFPDKFW